MMPQTTKPDSVTLFRGVRSTAWRRVLIAVFAVPMLLVGLFAMHVLEASGDPAGQHSAMSMSMSMATSPSMSSPVAPSSVSAPLVHTVAACDQFCGSAHDMGAMACILAILITVLALAIASSPNGWISPRPLAARIASAPRSLAIPRPPSLTALSISRI